MILKLKWLCLMGNIHNPPLDFEFNGCEPLDRKKVLVYDIIYYKNTFGVQNLHLGYKILTFDINSDII